MLSEDVLNALPDVITLRLEKLNREYIIKLCRRIKEIGEMSITDIHRLQRMKLYGADIREITKEINSVMNLNVQDIYSMYDLIATENVDFSERFYNSNNFIPYSENANLQRYVKSIARATADEYMNISNTTAFMRSSKNGKKAYTSISKTYQNVVDEAITAASSGLTDYHSAMRPIITELTDTGMRKVDYATGYSRRLDTAVRANILEGIRQVNQGVQDEIGKEIGADGKEISVHQFPAPDHADIQGKQYTNAGYKKLNSELERPIGTLNCKHYTFSIILGISKPIYSQKELEEIKRQNEEGITYEGKHYTMYEATQKQRDIETAIRRARDRYEAFKASGDSDAQRKAREKINQLTYRYRDFSDKAGLRYKTDRLNVKISKKDVAKTENSDIIASGGFSGAKKTPGWRNRHADRMYEEIRHRTTDVKKISENTPFTEKAVTEIKQHMFFKEHKFADGTIKRFDYDFDQAQTWDRLSKGEGTATDIEMLKHEYVELTQMRLYDYDYETAHSIANSRHNWWSLVEKE